MIKSDFTQAIGQLGLEQDEYVVIGSGVLAALDIREVDDVDLVVSGSALMRFEKSGEWKRKYFDDGTYYLLKDIYEIGLDWDSENAEPNLQDLKKDQLVIDNIPYISLERLKKWKLKKGREKDLADAKLIEQYQSEHPQ